jgi:Tfp pilus assembly protein FimT
MDARESRTMTASGDAVNRGAGSPQARNLSLRRNRGFTIVELLTVITIIMIVVAISIIKLQPVLQEQNANAAMAQVTTQLRIAREEAVAERRNVQVQFVGTNSIQLTEINTGVVGAGANQILSTTTLPSGAQFVVFSTLPDTPDAFGNAGAIEFESVVGGPNAGMMFQSDGTFADMGTGNPINGTVFVGLPGQAATARAVTVLGASGRIRQYKGISGSPGGWLK